MGFSCRYTIHTVDPMGLENSHAQCPYPVLYGTRGRSLHDMLPTGSAVVGSLFFVSMVANIPKVFHMVNMTYIMVKRMYTHIPSYSKWYIIYTSWCVWYIPGLGYATSIYSNMSSSKVKRNWLRNDNSESCLFSNILEVNHRTVPIRVDSAIPYLHNKTTTLKGSPSSVNLSSIGLFLPLGALDFSNVIQKK